MKQVPKYLKSERYQRIKVIASVIMWVILGLSILVVIGIL